MATELSTFAELKKAPAGGEQAPAPARVKEIDAQGRAYATGRRKNAVARVWVKLGTGKSNLTGLYKYFCVVFATCSSMAVE